MRDEADSFNPILSAKIQHKYVGIARNYTAAARSVSFTTLWLGRYLYMWCIHKIKDSSVLHQGEHIIFDKFHRNSYAK